MVIRLLGGRKANSILEIGYGSGLFLPELSKWCDNLTGIDRHDRAAEVNNMLNEERVKARLIKQDITADMTIRERFDIVVAVSVLEHLTDLDTVFRNIRDLMHKDSELIVGFPTENAITRTLFRLLGYDPRRLHPTTHSEILSKLGQHFVVKEIKSWPSVLPVDWSLYVTVKCGIRV